MQSSFTNVVGIKSYTFYYTFLKTQQWIGKCGEKGE